MRLLRWPTTEQASGEDATSDGGYREASESTEKSAVAFSWSSSPTLQKIYHGFEEQQRILEQLKAHLEDQLAPFQRHLGAHRVSIDNALRSLDRRLKPLRQYVQSETENLERVTTHLEAGLRDQFEDFEELLATQQTLLESANRYIEEQPLPLVTYLEDGQRVIEMIYGDLEQRLETFLQNLEVQQQILDSLREPELISEYETLTKYLEERQRALTHYARTGEYRPAEFFAKLDDAAERHKPVDSGQHTLFSRIYEEARQADQKLRKALAVPDVSPCNRDVVRGQFGNVQPDMDDSTTVDLHGGEKQPA